MQLPMKLGIGGGIMFSISVFFLFIAFPKILKSQIHKASALIPGSEMRNLWADLPIPLDFRIFLFNITNAEAIAQGENPIVKEVGPFFYDEYKQKVDLVDREEDDTLEYSLKTTWKFNAAKSNGLTGEEEIVFPHLLMLGIIMGTLKEKPTAMGLVGKAINSIFQKPESIFIKAKVKDILFDGLPIDCTVTDFAGSAVCTILKEQAADLVNDGENKYLFSFFGGDEHEIFVEFEPMTGTPVSARKRLQFNIFIQPIDKLKLMKNFPYALLPLLWVEEGILLEGDFIKQLKSVFTVLKVVAAFKYIFLFGGLGMCGAAGYLQYRKRVSNTMEVTKMPENGSKPSTRDGDDEKKEWPLNVQTLQGAAVPANLD
ncbi:sensory neuron membrane protein 1-like isoform X2 [Belonocnema kinseyi]|uniref:sensory neuron membrane protein 1-like isoform X2 n=1 Tax=Belonocnema kinseyi TaxID=2817044 RepID=UPI00143D88F8|nr:sensory neuron membrane protein 1-like isoform X2 [Belonocnema kinseyi]